MRLSSRPSVRGWLDRFLKHDRGRISLKRVSIKFAGVFQRDKRDAFGRGSRSIESLHHRASGNVGARTRLLVGSERIQIDALRLVGLDTLFNRVAAVNMHQGLHTPGVEMIDMLMAQRDRQ